MFENYSYQLYHFFVESVTFTIQLLFMQTLTISLIQTHLHWEDKTANLQMLEQKIMGISQKTELVVLPEMFSTGFSMKPELFAETMEGPTLQWMKRIAAEKKNSADR